jgi:3-hydroxy-5-phosphonooxypentane-2,4-dione thiolase
MDWGMRNRLTRIVRPDTGRTVMLAVDHGYFMGPTHRLENPGKTIEPLLPFADSLMITRGIVRSAVPPSAAVPIVLRVSGGTSILADDLSGEGIMTTMTDALRLNAAAVALSIFIGTPHERDSLLNLGALVSEGQECGMPVLAVTAVGKELEKRDARYLALCCRIAAEAGAHLVKTYYCDGFDKVVEGCPVPLVVAGGPKLDTEMDVFELTSRAVRQGAAGVDMGRNIWQHPAPVAMIKAVRAIVHDQATPEDAMALFHRARPGEAQHAAKR